MSARKRPRARWKSAGSDGAGADQASQDGVEFHHRQVGEKVTRAGLGEQGVDLSGADLWVIVLDGGAGIKKTVSHPGPF